MMTTSRALITSTCVLTLAPMGLEAQTARSYWNNAITQMTIDASSLGFADRAELEYSIFGADNGTFIAGARLAGGTARITYTHRYFGKMLGVGYGRSIVSQSAGPLGTFGLGFDLSGAYDVTRSPGLAARAGQLTIPLSLRWGSPKGFSVTPFFGPYAQIGLDKRFVLNNCTPTEFCDVTLSGLEQTRGFGYATGLDMTVWKLGFQFAYRRVATPFAWNRYQLGFSSRLRF